MGERTLTGTVVDSGDGVTHVIPVVSGWGRRGGGRGDTLTVLVSYNVHVHVAGFGTPVFNSHSVIITPKSPENDHTYSVM